ncbi:DUF6745 domain-containing protein [Pseudonocardia sp. TRM90224]|uniref:DUF6745 domain-containing protein n=1 Tax=Pseudonocardia sp. TRM90224 TaxID=2812678 RepID=UPI001E56E2E7|nr:hypothetical protein [Pseudonocardia sp. TRM90224]
MSARRRRISRPVPIPHDPTHDLEIWSRAVDIRTEWLGHALSCEPADRDTAEAAIQRLYALVGRPSPSFVWADSPAAALQVRPPPSSSETFADPSSVAHRIASAVSSMRERLDRQGRVRPPPWPARQIDPLSALRSGTDLTTVLEAGGAAVLRRVVHDSIVGHLRAELALPRLGLHWSGQHDVDWIARCEINRRLFGTQFGAADTAQLELRAALARSCGWWWPHDDVCIVVERPLVMHVEPVPGLERDEVRPHHGSGPAVVYPDGWAVHSWHGTRVPQWVITEPTADRIAEERNVEIRRCAIERMSWPDFIAEAGLTLVAQRPDPGNPGHSLQLYELPYHRWAARTRLLLAVNGSVERDGTRRRYGLHVPNMFSDPIDAAAWPYGLTGDQYAQMQRRT